eukprot:CAMPEP_0184416808 /NCGR_PEP_ID=MMETSP0738-20130409/9763_1 /TAXON_ID=385413 /ORGANISM="Thalassiosira miniscula, Strain CCMP1093" /LENGTH=92 /DNA_ID=CAMNT_0026776333 /DNA_START=76 /DNA_END=350 /DNA_ORIENTATION=-
MRGGAVNWNLRQCGASDSERGPRLEMLASGLGEAAVGMCIGNGCVLSLDCESDSGGGCCRIARGDCTRGCFRIASWDRDGEAVESRVGTETG